MTTVQLIDVQDPSRIVPKKYPGRRATEALSAGSPESSCAQSVQRSRHRVGVCFPALQASLLRWATGLKASIPPAGVRARQPGNGMPTEVGRVHHATGRGELDFQSAAWRSAPALNIAEGKTLS